MTSQTTSASWRSWNARKPLRQNNLKRALSFWQNCAATRLKIPAVEISSPLVSLREVLLGAHWHHGGGTLGTVVILRPGVALTLL